MKIFKIIFIAIIILLFASYLTYDYYISSEADKNGSDTSFIINKGESVKQIGDNLKKEKLIKSKTVFKIFVWANKKEAGFQAGEYILSPKLNLKEIIRTLTSGETFNKEKTIKIIEGWTIEDMGSYLEKEGIISKKEFISLTKIKLEKNNFSDYDFLKDNKASNLEGYLFPDTYRIFKDATGEDVIKKMLANFGDKLNPELREEIKKQNKTISEIITIASLIEKEVSGEKDMKIVSGILWQRLEIGQALQLDATLSYVLNDNKTSHSQEETEINSPYNTYRNKGLPPGPIANPGFTAIKAAVYPAKTEYNYFLTTKEGKIIYSRTFEEHKLNKAKYLN